MAHSIFSGIGRTLTCPTATKNRLDKIINCDFLIKFHAAKVNELIYYIIDLI
jgi:hypothetical protein